MEGWGFENRGCGRLGVGCAEVGLVVFWAAVRFDAGRYYGNRNCVKVVGSEGIRSGGCVLLMCWLCYTLHLITHHITTSPSPPSSHPARTAQSQKLVTPPTPVVSSHPHPSPPAHHHPCPCGLIPPSPPCPNTTTAALPSHKQPRSTHARHSTVLYYTVQRRQTSDGG